MSLVECDESFELISFLQAKGLPYAAINLFGTSSSSELLLESATIRYLKLYTYTMLLYTFSLSKHIYVVF